MCRSKDRGARLARKGQVPEISHLREAVQHVAMGLVGQGFFRCVDDFVQDEPRDLETRSLDGAEGQKRVVETSEFGTDDHDHGISERSCEIEVSVLPRQGDQ